MPKMPKYYNIFYFFLQVVAGGFIFLFLFFLNNIAEKLKTLWGWQGGVFCFFPFWVLKKYGVCIKRSKVLCLFLFNILKKNKIVSSCKSAQKWRWFQCNSSCYLVATKMCDPNCSSHGPHFELNLFLLVACNSIATIFRLQVWGIEIDLAWVRSTTKSLINEPHFLKVWSFVNI